MEKENPDATSKDLVFVSEAGTTIDRHNINRTLRAMADRCDCKNKKVGSHAL